MKPNQFDEVAKAMALSVTRRAAVKKFGYGLTTLALAALGLSTKAQAAKPVLTPRGRRCKSDAECYSDNPYLLGKCIKGHCHGDVGAICVTDHDCVPGLTCRFTGSSTSGYMWRCYP